MEYALARACEAETSDLQFYHRLEQVSAYRDVGDCLLSSKRQTPMHLVLDAACSDTRKAILIETLWGTCGVPTESCFAQSALSLAVSYNNVLAADALLCICGATFSRHNDPSRILTLYEPVEQRQMGVLRMLAQHAPRLASALEVNQGPYSDKLTALHAAAAQNNTEAAELLVNVFRASIEVVDARGLKPRDLLRGNASYALRALLGAP